MVGTLPAIIIRSHEIDIAIDRQLLLHFGSMVSPTSTAMAAVRYSDCIKFVQCVPCINERRNWIQKLSVLHTIHESLTVTFRQEIAAVPQLGVIPARYASTRFPGKPLVMIAGKPMIVVCFALPHDAWFDSSTQVSHHGVCDNSDTLPSYSDSCYKHRMLFWNNRGSCPYSAHTSKPRRLTSWTRSVRTCSAPFHESCNVYPPWQCNIVSQFFDIRAWWVRLMEMERFLTSLKYSNCPIYISGVTKIFWFRVTGDRSH